MEYWVSFPYFSRKILKEKVSEIETYYSFSFDDLNLYQNKDVFNIISPLLSEKTIRFDLKNDTLLLKKNGDRLTLSHLYLIENNRSMDCDIFNIFIGFHFSKLLFISEK